MRFASALVVLSNVMVVQSNTLAKVRAVLREYHDGIGLEGGVEEKERQQGKLRSLLTALGMQDDITPAPAAPAPDAAAPPAPPLPDGEHCSPDRTPLKARRKALRPVPALPVLVSCMQSVVVCLPEGQLGMCMYALARSQCTLLQSCGEPLCGCPLPLAMTGHSLAGALNLCC